MKEIFNISIKACKIVMKNDYPPGLEYYPNWLSQQEHNILWKKINEADWGTWENMGVKRRRVQQYGYIYHYRKQGFIQDEDTPRIPPWLDILLDRLVLEGVFSKKPNQVIINEYVQLGLRKWAIPSHYDSPILFGDAIASITLGSPCIVEFKKGFDDENILCVPVDTRSLYVMKKESRYDYVHGIPDKKYNEGKEFPEGNTRISITIREAKPGAESIETTKPSMMNKME